MNPGFKKLQPYPFEELARLQAAITPADMPAIDLSIGEPKHPTPPFILDSLRDNLNGASKYPSTRGTPALRAAIRRWLIQRFSLPDAGIDSNDHILPVTGTREALFAFAQYLIDPVDDALVLTGNPFYQIYEGAAFLAGAGIHYVNCLENNRFIPDFSGIDAGIWDRCQLLYLCSPNNPCGSVIDIDTYRTLLQLAEKHDFVIAADECYSEIYLDEGAPPPGLLQAAMACGYNDFRRCMVFHSLSKRSNVPGMRSGFVAGDAALIEKFYLYRTYHGCSMAPYAQAASIVAWDDEEHVRDNREQYRRKFDAVLDILSPVMNVQRPSAGFYLWPETPVDDVEFTRLLLERQNVRVLPGSFMSRRAGGINPGSRRIRVALVASLDECVAAAERIRYVVESL
ncbi:MAG: succinyldiaminopimelate transaminase [Gammaproteobacteria bacterium]